MNTCVNLVSASIPHQTKTVTTNNINITKTGSHYIMLPVWMVNIKYKDKMYTFAMNGQTGKIIGNLPIGVLETLMWSVIVFIGLFLLAVIVMYFVA